MVTLKCLILFVLAVFSWFHFVDCYSFPNLNLFKKGSSTLPDLYEASIQELQAGLDAGRFTSVDLVKAYFARIEEVNLQGPQLRAILEINPSALAQAAVLDKERKVSGKRSVLHGIPVLLKDNMATVASEGMNTTAGSYSLLGSVVPEDAGVVKRLRKAGAIILGKANLSEWAHFRGNTVASGWSGRGGQCTNAYFPNADPSGSSSGSGVATSIGLTAVSLGTETDGSITSPTNKNNLAGIKPTLGLTSRAGVIPISAHQDTVGPMTRSMTDAAIVLNIIAGRDPNDNYTFAQPRVVPDFTKALKKSALRGKRIGVPRAVFLNSTITGNDPFINVVFEQALKTIKRLGATVVDPADMPGINDIVATGSRNEFFVNEVDFKVQLNDYFAALLENPSGVRSVADLIKFNDDHASTLLFLPLRLKFTVSFQDLEEPPGYESQDLLTATEATSGFNSTFFDALAFNIKAGATNGIDFALKKFNLDALVLPTPGLATKPGALAGYPIVTVPLGFFPDNVTIRRAGPVTFYPAPGVPIGLSFLGTAFSDFDLIGYAYAYEQETKTRLARKAVVIPSAQLSDFVGK